MCFPVSKLASEGAQEGGSAVEGAIAGGPAALQVTKGRGKGRVGLRAHPWMEGLR